MKRFLILLAFLCLNLFQYPHLCAAQVNETELIETLFIHLQQGDTDAIVELFTEPLLSKKKELFENNRSYSNFLKQTYRDAILTISKIEILDDDRSVADIEIQFANEDPALKTRFVLKNLNGTWKISSEEILDSTKNN
jgi:hypothetical protein